MRILLLANHLDAGGISSYLATLSRGLVAKGHRVVIVAGGGNMSATFQSLGVRHVRLNFRLKSEINPVLLPCLAKCFSLIKEEKIDIMHPQTRATAMLAALSSKLSGIPYVTTCHGYFKSHWGRRIFPLWGCRVIAISRPVSEHLHNDLGVARERIDLVPNGINLKSFRPVSDVERSALRKKWGVGSEATVGIVARLSDVKGHAYLIEAMALVRNFEPAVKCLVFGEGPLEGELRKRVAMHGLEDTVLFYPVNNRTAEVLGLIDIFVMPSLSEGLGLSAMEAMAAGLPTVASSVGGLLDLISDRSTGRLVPVKDPVALAQAIQEMLADPAGARALGARAREYIRANYSDDKMVAGTISVYQRALGR